MSEQQQKDILRSFVRKMLVRRGITGDTLEDMMVMWEQNYPISVNDLVARYTDMAKGDVLV